jgi:hypothetical protein
MIGMGLWVLRNVQQTGTMAGPRPVSRDTLSVNVERVAVEWSLWLFPNEIPTSVRVSLVVVLMLAVGGGLAAVYRRTDLDGSDWARRTWGEESLFAAVFVLTYVAFLVVVTTRVAIDPIAGRLLLPTYVPLVVVGLQSLSVLAAAWNGTVGALRSCLVD